MVVLAQALHDDGEKDDVDAGHGVGAAGAEGVDVGGVVLAGVGHVDAVGEGAAEGDVHVGAVEGAEGAVGVGVGAVVDEDAVGAGEVVADVEGVAAGVAAGAAGEGTAVVAAVHVGAEGEPVGAVHAEDVEHVNMESAGHEQGGGTEAGAEAEHVVAEAVGGEDHVDGDTVHLHSCQLSASFYFVSEREENSKCKMICIY